jgi:nucleoside-diphosphate-sugar epimerase
VRTIIDVRDAMRAYWEAALHCTPGEAYNIGGKSTMSVGEVLSILKSLANTTIISRIDPSLLRPADVTLQIPSTEKFENATGWKPEFEFEDSISFLLDHWRREVAKEVQQSI